MICLLCLGLMSPVHAAPTDAGDPVDNAMTASEVELGNAFDASLARRTGDIALAPGLATFHTGDAYVFLSPDDAERVLTAWGNPPGFTGLGMILPAGAHALGDSWAVVVEYQDDGHVSDEDAAEMDYGEMIREMQASTEADNESRVAAGYGAVDLVGWAEPPHYDPASHKFYWAKELAFAGEEDHTLNYNIRVLGRTGVLVMNAVATMDDLATIGPAMEGVMAGTRFDEGQRYADFDPKSDRVAAYGIGALVAGKVAAKAGLFKGLMLMLVAGKKFVLLGLVAAFAAFKSLFGGQDDEDDGSQGL